MMPMIKRGELLVQYFEDLIKSLDEDRYSRRQVESWLANGVFVSSSIRKEVLISDCQGVITFRGKKYELSWNDVGGGVWKAFIHLNEINF
jgi:hypothetical protein